MKLTLKQQRFADEYIISGNATQAAIKAGYSEKTANRIATENLSKPVIKAYVDKRLAELEDAKIAKQEEVEQPEPVKEDHAEEAKNKTEVKKNT